MAFVRSEGLALLDAEGHESRQRDAVALFRRLLVDDARDDLPIGEAARLRAGPSAKRSSNKSLMA